MYKTFIIFSSGDHVLFHRNDAEMAEWCHQEFTLNCTFPYDPNKVLERGMRIGFMDALGRFQLFEMRYVKTSEPEHIQEVNAEHIVISELTDRHLVAYQPTTKVNAQTAISALLSGTGWSIGTCVSTETGKPDLSMTSVWSALTEVRDGYGLRLDPYVTISGTAITGRYINVMDNVGVWRGVRLSINKNIDSVGVTYDDTSLVTAVYGYGSALSEEYEIPIDPNAPTDPSPTPTPTPPDYGADYVTIRNVVWTATADHPAKPAGQMYLEDPEATALYGRNGVPRFGFYSNSSCDDANDLIDLCWQALKNQSKPKITIDCTISELYSLGYEGEQIQIGDTVRVEIEPIGTVLELMCICLTEDLLNPTQTRPTIGKYIKDIVYISREEAYEAAGGGGGGGGGSGGGGGGNKDQIEQEKSVYTNFERTDEYILMQAVSIQKVEGAMTTAFSEIYMNAQEIDLEVSRATDAEESLDAKITINADEISSLVSKTGVDDLAADETLFSKITQNATAITSEIGRAQGEEQTINSRITQTATEIRSEVSAVDGRVSTLQQTVDGITLTGNVISIKGNSIDLDGYTTLTDFTALSGEITNLKAGYTSFTGISCTGNMALSGTANVGALSVNGQVYTDHQIKMTGITASTRTLAVADADLTHSHEIAISESGGTISVTIKGPQIVNGSDSFNIAATQFYQDGVAAARDAVTVSGSWSGSTYTATASNGKSSASTTISVTSGSWSAGSIPVYAFDGTANRASGSVEIPAATSVTGTEYAEGLFSISYTVGGKAFTESGVQINASYSYNAGYAAGQSDVSTQFRLATVTLQGTQVSSSTRKYVHKAGSGKSFSYVANTTLYYNRGSGYESAGSGSWYLGGSGTTYYEDGGYEYYYPNGTYYNAGTTYSNVYYTKVSS